MIDDGKYRAPARGNRVRKAWRRASVWGLRLLAPVAGLLAFPPTPLVARDWTGDGEAGASVTRCRAIDGDTLVCAGRYGREHIRLVGIDAPEMPGHCRAGRHCVAGDPFAAQRALAERLAPALAITRFGLDHYGRTIAAVAGPSGDLSCAQLRGGHALYVARWDDDRHVARACGAMAASARDHGRWAVARWEDRS